MAKTSFAKEHLKSIVQRIERLEEEKAALAGDISEVYRDAKGQGFDTRIIKALIKERKEDQVVRDERAALLDLYRAALEPSLAVVAQAAE